MTFDLIQPPYGDPALRRALWQGIDLLQDLIGTIQHLELQRCAHNLEPPSIIVERCWELEDLGQLRGLSVRTAAHRTCPLEMLIQLQYLHERLLRHAPARCTVLSISCNAASSVPK